MLLLLLMPFLPLLLLLLLPLPVLFLFLLLLRPLPLLLRLLLRLCRCSLCRRYCFCLCCLGQVWWLAYLASCAPPAAGCPRSWAAAVVRADACCPA